MSTPTVTQLRPMFFPSRFKGLYDFRITLMLARREVAERSKDGNYYVVKVTDRANGEHEVMEDGTYFIKPLMFEVWSLNYMEKNKEPTDTDWISAPKEFLEQLGVDTSDIDISKYLSIEHFKEEMEKAFIENENKVNKVD